MWVRYKHDICPDIENDRRGGGDAFNSSVIFICQDNHQSINFLISYTYLCQSDFYVLQQGQLKVDVFAKWLHQQTRFLKRSHVETCQNVIVSGSSSM